MDTHLAAFTKPLMQHLTLFYSTGSLHFHWGTVQRTACSFCHSSVSIRVNPQFWRVTRVPKLPAFPARTTGSAQTQASCRPGGMPTTPQPVTSSPQAPQVNDALQRAALSQSHRCKTGMGAGISSGLHSPLGC